MLDIKDIFHIWTLFTQDVLGNSQRCVPINIHIMCLLGLMHFVWTRLLISRARTGNLGVVVFDPLNSWT